MSVKLQNVQSSLAARELEQHPVDVKPAQLAVADVVDCLGDVRNEFGKPRLVVRGEGVACLTTL